MEICRFLRTTLIFLFLFLPFQTIAEDQLTKTKINALDFTMLKYELFLNKNLQRLFGGGGLVNPIISYEHVDYNVKYKEDNYFLIEIYAYMNKHRYTNKVKYTPKNKDCNTVRNKIFLNKIGYYFLSKKNKKTFNQEDLNQVLKNQIFNFSGLTNKVKQSVIDNTEIKINIVHPINNKSIKCSGKINQTDLN